MPHDKLPGTEPHHPGDRSSREDEEEGAKAHYADPDLYDRLYERRRRDVSFYRTLADERLGFGAPSAVLELACGTGRLTVPLLRAGHRVLAFDRAPAMLNKAQRRIARLSRSRRQNALLFRADLRAFQLGTKVSFAVSAFHSIQHLVSDEDLLCCFARVHESLRDDGWFAFDVLPPHPAWLGQRELLWDTRTFRHPRTEARVRQGTAFSYDPIRKALHIDLHHRIESPAGQPQPAEEVVKLCHRQFWPGELEALLDQAGFRVLARYGDFDHEAALSREELEDPAATFDEHIFVACPKR